MKSRSARAFFTCFTLMIICSALFAQQTDDKFDRAFLTLRADSRDGQPEFYSELLFPMVKMGLYYRPENDNERMQFDSGFTGPLNFSAPWRFGVSVTFSESEFPRWLHQDRENFKGQAHFLIQYQKQTERLFLPINLYYPLARTCQGNHWTWRARIDDFHWLLTDGGRTKIYLAGTAEFREGEKPQMAGGIRIDHGQLFIRALAGSEDIYSLGYSIEITGLGE